MAQEPHEFEEEGKRAFAAGQYAQAVHAFEQASQGYTLANDGLHAAEMQNNLSVALLHANRPQEALAAVTGADKIFEDAQDVKRQAMSLGNQAAALDALKRTEEAIQLYERAAALFGQIGEGDLRSMVLKSAAAIRLKQGKLNETALNMLGSLGAVEKPNFFQRILKFFLRFLP